MTLTSHELIPADWPIVEALFGTNGACGGCWCMSWRITKGRKWDQVKGAEAKRRLQTLIENGQAHAILAFQGDEPVGWCSIGPRRDYAKLKRPPASPAMTPIRSGPSPAFMSKRASGNRASVRRCWPPPRLVRRVASPSPRLTPPSHRRMASRFQRRSPGPGPGRCLMPPASPSPAIPMAGSNACARPYNRLPANHRWR